MADPRQAYFFNRLLSFVTNLCLFCNCLLFLPFHHDHIKNIPAVCPEAAVHSDTSDHIKKSPRLRPLCFSNPDTSDSAAVLEAFKFIESAVAEFSDEDEEEDSEGGDKSVLELAAVRCSHL